MIKATIIADSITPLDNRLTTFVLKYPRYIHSQFMTHRAFSRNASSSRAIPVSKMLVEVVLEPVNPSHWGANQPGMQAKKEIDSSLHPKLLGIWDEARSEAVRAARMLDQMGVHKQVVNRLIEPFMHITVICTATDYGNWFKLRCHDAAQPEIAELATKMKEQYEKKTPKLMEHGKYHLPFISQSEFDVLDFKDAVKCSVARCARVSYKNHDGSEPDVKKDIELHDRLKADGHWSPFEHIAMSVFSNSRYANYRGWIQYRTIISTK